ncbi:MAG: aminoacyl-tRNA hydrolase, partial [Polyangia bacterium]|nr:aminoacyl-tRNA hydrolase [Polyangia bacterium]
SIASELGSTEFLRVRLGIGRPLAGDLSEHVLGPWDPAEYEVRGDLLDRACEATMQLLADGIALASNRWNVRPRGTPRAPSNDREMDPSDEQGDERPAKGTISEPRGDADKGQMDGDSGRDP